MPDRVFTRQAGSLTASGIWAAGARSPEQAAAGITRGLSEAARQPHASGGTVFSCDTSSGYYQDALYRAFENTITLPQFFMADWLACLRGEQSRGYNELLRLRQRSCQSC